MEHCGTTRSAREADEARTSSSTSRGLSVYYGEFRAVRDVTLPIQQEPDHRPDRAVRLRQDHGPAVPEPDERPDRERARSRARSCITASTCTTPTSTPSRCAGASGWSSRSPTRSPSRSTTTSRSARRSPGSRATWTTSSSSRCEGGPVGRGQGQAEGIGDGAVGRAAAAAVHRAGDRVEARRDPDGRAVLGARPDRDARGSRTSCTSWSTEYTIVIVTHNMQQAARVSDRTAFFTVEVSEEGQRTGVVVEFDRHGDDLHQSRPTNGPRTT